MDILRQQLEAIDRELHEYRNRKKTLQVFGQIAQHPDWKNALGQINEWVDVHRNAILASDPMTEATKMARIQGEVSALRRIAAIGRDVEGQLKMVEEKLDSLNLQRIAILEDLRK